MRRLKNVVWLTVLLLLLLSARSNACSTFYIADQAHPVFGKNYDWEVDDGLVIVNKRRVTKTAFSEQPALTWTSKYGSITFNQYGREFAHGGMNEAGLVVELMWLQDTQYPAPDNRVGLDCLQWVQYQLDTSATVAEVLAADAAIRITPQSAPLHYLVCDRTGACAAIEFLHGQMVAHAGSDLPVRVLTNSTYERSAAFLQQCEGFGGTQPIGSSYRSLDRFARAANWVKQNNATDPVGYAFDILTDVAQGEWTKWSIVYEMEGGRISFRTHANPDIRFVDLAAFDFDCSTPVKVLDINAAGSGDVGAHFEEYGYQFNRALIGNAYRKTDFLRDVSSTALDSVAAYPGEATECEQK